MNVLEVIKMNIKSYRSVTCFMEPDDNILFFNYQQNLIVDLPLAKELIANRLQFTKNKKHYMIQQISGILDINYEALQYFKDNEHGLKNILGVAYLAQKPLSIEIANVFVEHQRKIPSKIFPTEEKAFNWIKELKEYHRVTQQ